MTQVSKAAASPGRCPSGDAEQRSGGWMLSEGAFKHSRRPSLWHVPLILKAKTKQLWKSKELSRWIFVSLGQPKSGCLCVSALFRALGDVPRKNTFWGDMKSALWWYQDVLQIDTDLAEGFKTQGEEKKR